MGDKKGEARVIPERGVNRVGLYESDSVDLVQKIWWEIHEPNMDMK